MSSITIIIVLFLVWCLIAGAVCVGASRHSAQFSQAKWEEGDGISQADSSTER